MSPTARPGPFPRPLSVAGPAPAHGPVPPEEATRTRDRHRPSSLWSGSDACGLGTRSPFTKGLWPQSWSPASASQAINTNVNTSWPCGWGKGPQVPMGWADTQEPLRDTCESCPGGRGGGEAQHWRGRGVCGRSAGHRAGTARSLGLSCESPAGPASWETEQRDAEDQRSSRSRQPRRHLDPRSPGWGAGGRGSCELVCPSEARSVRPKIPNNGPALLSHPGV